MKVKLFYTTGKDDIQEMVWDKPDPKDDAFLSVGL